MPGLVKDETFFYKGSYTPCWLSIPFEVCLSQLHCFALDRGIGNLHEISHLSGLKMTFIVFRGHKWVNSNKQTKQWRNMLCFARTQSRKHLLPMFFLISCMEGFFCFYLYFTLAYCFRESLCQMTWLLGLLTKQWRNHHAKRVSFLTGFPGLLCKRKR